MNGFEDKFDADFWTKGTRKGVLISNNYYPWIYTKLKIIIQSLSFNFRGTFGSKLELQAAFMIDQKSTPVF